MKDYIVARVFELGRYIVDNSATVRDTAAVFGISKSTVHKDVSERLRLLNVGLYNEVHNILAINLNERHIRGGQATKKKFKREV